MSVYLFLCLQQIATWGPLLTLDRFLGCLHFLLDLGLLPNTLMVRISVFLSPSSGLLVTRAFRLNVERELLLETVSHV